MSAQAAPTAASRPPSPSSLWADAALAASLFAVDPAGTGGVTIRSRAGPVRERWLTLLLECLPSTAAVRKLPVHVSDGRLLGGLDLAATLRAGRPVAERGLLADADGGVLLLSMAERLAPATAARLGAALDAGEVVAERDGMTLRSRARFGVVALDEGAAEEERPPAALLDRLAFHLDLDPIGIRELGAEAPARDVLDAARAGLASVTAADDIVAALCAAAQALGIDSLRAPLLALRVARAAAALAGRGAVAEPDAALAARLVLAPRATVLPAPEEPEQARRDQGEPTQPESESAPDRGDEEGAPDADRPLDEIVLEATRSAIPAGLLAQLRLAGAVRSRLRAPGRAGDARVGVCRGRPAGVRQGEPGGGARLSVIETLRAAAPWQPLRRRERAGDTASDRGRALVEVRRDDFRITRFKQRTQTTSIFVVDASGSAALHRLAEAKGAVELLLAQCYVRRDQVALLAFRGQGAELLLPPTRSLVRAKRCLAGLPGGGGTPLAAGIDAAFLLADGARRRGGTPVLILLTDGRANIARDGNAGRARAEEDALDAARRIRAGGFTALLVDTSPRPQPVAQRLAEEMGARYLPLPYADAQAIAQAVM